MKKILFILACALVMGVASCVNGSSNVAEESAVDSLAVDTVEVVDSVVADTVVADSVQ